MENLGSRASPKAATTHEVLLLANFAAHRVRHDSLDPEHASSRGGQSIQILKGRVRAERRARQWLVAASLQLPFCKVEPSQS